MEFLNPILDHTIMPAASIIRRDWRGFLIGIGLCLAVFLLLFLSPVCNYYSLGTFVGTYEVSIGRSVTVARNELRIHFDEQFFSTKVTHYDETTGVYHEDTTWLYPLFEIYPVQTGKDMYRFPSYQVGKRLGVDGDSFYFTIELTSLDDSGADTVAHFKVHKREYPETIRTTP
ncbi:MAG: hypothetical protein J7J98_04520 [candidate division Zixibacteria bacterium]|nr:hypothetical protein [candidate division Zixibacteria bacterium]